MLLITHGDLLEEMLRVSLAHAPLSLSLSKISADSVAGWDQLALDFAPGLLPRVDKWSQLISSDFFFFSHVHIHATALEAVQNPQPRFHLILLLLLLINIGSYTATCQSLWLRLAFAAPRGAFELCSRNWRDLLGKALHSLCFFSCRHGPLKSYSFLSTITFISLFVQICERWVSVTLPPTLYRLIEIIFKTKNY